MLAPRMSGLWITMSKKEPEVVRRVWRMTAESPAGEYLDLELVPKETSVRSATEAAPRRTLYPETRPAFKTVSVASNVSAHASSAQITAPGPTFTTVPRTAPPRELPSADLQLPPAARVRVLRPAQAESWQASSFDLLTGCVVRDVTDTIPAKIFDGLFGSGDDDFFPLGRRQRR